MLTSTSPPYDWLEGRRLRAWSLKEQGWKQRAIAQALGVTEGAVSQWLRRGREEGVEALRRVPRSGGVSKLRPDQQLTLLEMLSFGAEAFGFTGAVWTGPRVASLIQHFLGVSYHPKHIPRMLRGWGWSVQKPICRATQRDEEAIAQWSSQTWPQLKKGNDPTAHPRLHRRSRFLPVALDSTHLGSRGTARSFIGGPFTGSPLGHQRDYSRG